MLVFDLLDRIISVFYEVDIVVRSNQCSKLRYPRSKCQGCLENCSPSAISLQQKTVYYPITDSIGNGWLPDDLMPIHTTLITWPHFHTEGSKLGFFG